MLLLAIEWTHLTIILLQIVFILGFTFLLYKVCAIVYKKVKSLLSTNGISALSSFLSMGISVIFFYKTFSSLLLNLGKFLSQTMSSISTYVINLDSREKNLTLLTDSILTSFNENILSIPFVSILIFCVVWVFISILIQGFMKGDAAESAVHISSIFKTTTWRYFVFGILIVFGVFLSIASIIAVPIFQEDQNDNPSVEALRIAPELDNYMPDSAGYYNKYLIQIDTARDKSIGILALSQIENWNDLVSSTYTMILQNKDRAIGRLNSAREEKLTADAKVDYERVLVEWFLANKTNLINNLNANKPEVNTWINTVYQSNLLAAAGSATSTTIDNQLDKSKLSIDERSLVALPPVPSISEGYGIFGWIAGWILKPNNLSFALIVGMIGFGVFGATISHIILETTDATETTEFSSIDYLKLLVRGFSAAIVIYLAAKGGLLIVSGSEASLNSYIIFFFCFVSSVFSEVVWNWVKEKLITSLNNSKQ